ncbi:MAG TPA: helix-turn-helix transcriptional regulator [Pedobacter sp.]|uniref:AraC family transcriptional regulator n=1 Tax=Pedobacter sp. TaxID=1411316 RepID=UPI002C0B29BC|nr:helix-turn-helix transcriptional regulator [Pedobacter sp.]HMI04552.1 helix-turn-helix transcriptional regulator [Pedobacter sp.]
MKNLSTGQFFGDTTKTIHLDGITLTDTEYTHDKVDWHYHENAYFTFILQGCVIEGNKKEIYHCPAGSLLFHNWQDAHYNIKPPGFTRGFQIELHPSWFNSLQLDFSSTEGSRNLLNPELKILMYKIFKETKFEGSNQQLNINALLADLFGRIAVTEETFSRKIPAWVRQIREILNDSPLTNWTLRGLAHTLAIHPVHLSRGFSKYFNCTLGEYIRTIKIERSMGMLTEEKYSLTEIALACGFADQSHFIRTFKELNDIRPALYRKLLLNRPC